MLTTADING